MVKVVTVVESSRATRACGSVGRFIGHFFCQRTTTPTSAFDLRDMAAGGNGKGLTRSGWNCDTESQNFFSMNLEVRKMKPPMDLGWPKSPNISTPVLS